MSESGETGDVIKGQGILEYGQALGVVEDTDPGLLIVLWKLGAKAQWEVSREEFVGGWTAVGYELALIYIYIYLTKIVSDC